MSDVTENKTTLSAQWHHEAGFVLKVEGLQWDGFQADKMRALGELCQRAVDGEIEALTAELANALVLVETAEEERDALRKQVTYLKDAVEGLGEISDTCTKGYTGKICSTCRCKHNQQGDK